MARYFFFNRQRFTAYMFHAFGVLLILLATGCGNEASEKIATASTEAGSASFSIQWHAAAAAALGQARADVGSSCSAAGIETITAEVYDESDNPIASGGPWACDSRSGRIEKIPAGPNNTLALLGWNTSGGEIVYHGMAASRFDINPGEITNAGTIDANPFVPTGLGATATVNGQIDLVWDNLGVAGYRIYRDGTAIATSGSPTYDDTNLGPDTQYCYTVCAYDDFGNESGHSYQVCQTTLPNAMWYRDADEDEFGNPTDSIQAADQPSGYVLDNTDCNDSTAAIYPGAPELCGNEIDEDCDGIADDGCTTYYRDADEDNYGDPNQSMEATAQPDGYVEDNTDCNDGDDTIHPGAPELNDGQDNDCDGNIDEGWGTYYQDADGDNFGNPNESIQATTQPDGYVEDNTDCNDGEPRIYPGANEICNAEDDDCDGGIDEGLSTDADRDGHYTPGSCFLPADDCDDSNSARFPGNNEICDNVDNDCDGGVDENLSRSTTCGVGACAGNTGTETCTAGNWGNNTCDADAGATSEVCDNVDNDCDGRVDENLSRSTTCGVGACAGNTGAETCTAGNWGNDTCDPYAGATSEAEACYDEIDNDCDGRADGEDDDCPECSYAVTIGDNDGYGYGIADNADLPESSGFNYPWIFDNRESSELSASDGSQHTDYEPYNSRYFYFTIRFCPADPSQFYYATFTLDVSGIQAESFGDSTLRLDGQDFSSYLDQEQGTYGSNVIRIYIYDVSMFTDGELTVEFQGGEGTVPGVWDPDAIAVDYFSLNTDNY